MNINRTHEMLNGSATTVDAAALSQRLVDFVANTGNGGTAEGETSDVIDSFGEVSGDIASFLERNPATLPLKVHPVLTAAISKPWPIIASSLHALTLQAFVKCITDALSIHFQVTWIARCLRMCDVVDSFDDFPKELKGIMSDGPKLEHFL